jgi:mono/diheme cytochrome c family protein
VDAEWVHGASEEEVLATITTGVAAKGMPAWGPVLGPDKVSKVAAFVVSKFRETGLEPVAVGQGTAEAPSDGAVDVDGAPEGDGSAEAPPEDPMVAGAKIFEQNCVACHGADMTGGIGPNLLDAEWIHGGEVEQIEQVITNGVPEKGMVSWGPILGEQKVGLVARYVHARANGG